MEYSPHRPDMSYVGFDHPVFDCDFHLYEGPDAFTRYLPRQYRASCASRTSTAAPR